MSRFSENLRRIRFDRHMTQEEFADLLGTTKQNISRYESGAVSPKISTAEVMAEKLGISLSELNGSEDATPPLPTSIRPISDMHRQKVPLIGRVAAGQPIMAETDYETFVDSPVDCDAALEIEGESMVPTYMPGDIIYIKHQPTVRDGQVAVVLLDDSATLKHVYRDKDGLTLLSDNRDYPPIRVTDAEYDYVAIYGVPVGYTRIYKPDPLKNIKKGF
jgi:repressor LexA